MAKAKKKQSSSVSLSVDGLDCELDLDKLTLGEIVEVERYFEKSISELDESDWNSTRGTVIIATIARRRVDARWTLAKTESLQVDALGDVEERPTQAKTPETSGSPS